MYVVYVCSVCAYVYSVCTCVVAMCVGGGHSVCACVLACVYIHMYHLCNMCIPDISFKSPSGNPGEPQRFPRRLRSSVTLPIEPKTGCNSSFSGGWSTAATMTKCAPGSRELSLG